jgi:hypothetical protein
VNTHRVTHGATALLLQSPHSRRRLVAPLSLVLLLHVLHHLLRALQAVLHKRPKPSIEHVRSSREAHGERGDDEQREERDAALARRAAALDKGRPADAGPTTDVWLT